MKKFLAAFAILFAIGCGERPPLPCDHDAGITGCQDEVTKASVIPSCQSLDHISGNWSMTIYYGSTVYDQNFMWAGLRCQTDNTTVDLHFGWTNYGWIPVVGYYNESNVVSAEWFSFSFIGGDGARYFPQYNSPAGCSHAPGINTWHCAMWREYPPGSYIVNPVIGNFVKQ